MARCRIARRRTQIPGAHRALGPTVPETQSRPVVPRGSLNDFDCSMGPMVPWNCPTAGVGGGGKKRTNRRVRPPRPADGLPVLGDPSPQRPRTLVPR